jgi:hypothetical protein
MELAMNRISRTCTIAISLLAVAFDQSMAMAESYLEPATEPAHAEAENSEFDLTVAAAYLYQFDSGIDNADDFSINRVGAAAGLRWQVSPDASLSFRLNYGFDSYDFGGGANPFGGVAGQDPWEDINTVDFGVILNYNVSDDFNLFGGAIFSFSGETGADWGDSFTGGGVIGGSYALSRDLRLGGGLAIVSQIEDNVKVIYIPVVEWKISDTWRISSGSTSNSSNLGVALTGVELIWTLSDKWQVSLGGAYDYSRFRLDDTGIAPDGVGEDRGWPIWLRAVWNITDRVQLEGVGGVILGGELTLENSGGSQIVSSDYDAAYFVGVLGSVRF